MKVHSSPIKAEKINFKKRLEERKKTAAELKKPRKEKLSNSEARKKIEAHFKRQYEMKAANLEITKKAKQRQGSEVVPGGAISANDPTSGVTQEKLKAVLSKGSFKFSDKERATLDKILNK